MGGRRVALLVGCSVYEDPDVPKLSAPAKDVEKLEGVLADPAIGNFTVRTLLNKPSEMVREEIEDFFAKSMLDDLLLLYFSCHGYLDSTGRLYFVAINTKKERPQASGITARWVKERMDESRSRRIVVLLDCCNGEAFAARGRAIGPKILQQELGGRGRVIIAASGNRENAYDSRFTDAVVRGLRTGEADLDSDGQISVSELYNYVYGEVCQGKPDQNPTMSGNVQGELYLANNPHALLPLPVELEQAVKSEISWQRRGAVDGLVKLLSGNPKIAQKRVAREALAILCDDTDLGVRRAARSASRKVSRQLHRNRWLAGVGVMLVALLVGVLWWPGLGDRSIALPNQPACSPGVKHADGVLTLGTLFPKTGEFAYTGPPLRAGAHLAIKDINEAGGIPGRAVTLDEANQRDEGDSSTIVNQSSDELLASGVDAIIGPGKSTAALKVIDKVVCAGTIMFAPSTTSPVLTAYHDHGFYFRTASTDALVGPLLGELVVKDGNSTALVISHNDEYANPLREATVKAIRESGGQVLDSFSYEPNAHDYEKEVQRIKAKNPDAIVLIGFFRESAQILAKLVEEGIGPQNKRVYGSDANMTNTLARQVNPWDPGVLVGMKGILPYAGSEMFTKRLMEANPGLQDLTYAAQSYDAVVITALAAAVASTDEPAAIKREINGVTKTGEKCTSFASCMTLVKDRKDIDYDGASGPLEFTDPGEPASVTYVTNEIQTDGTVKPLGGERAGS